MRLPVSTPGGDELLHLCGKVFRRARPSLAPLRRLPFDSVPQTFISHGF